MNSKRELSQVYVEDVVRIVWVEKVCISSDH
jgi:hypothetical protein